MHSTVFPHVSVSIGMATLEFPSHDPISLSQTVEDIEAEKMEYTPEVLLEMADQNLYIAKRNGRNQVC